MFGYNTKIHSGTGLYSGRFFQKHRTQSAFIGFIFNEELAVQSTGKSFLYRCTKPLMSMVKSFNKSIHIENSTESCYTIETTT